jgi:hypothetical protein
MIKFLTLLACIAMFSCTNENSTTVKHRERSSYFMSYDLNVSFKFPYTYTVYEPSSVGFYEKQKGKWAVQKELKEFDSIEYRYYSDTAYSFHRFKKDHSYGENLFPPDTQIILQKKIKLPKRDSSLLKFAFPSRETQNYFFDLSDSAGNSYEFSFYSWYRCTDPHCEMKHGHMNFNQSIYGNRKYAWSLRFNALDKRSFRIYFPKEGQTMPLELLSQLLKMHDFPEAAMEAVEGYYLK